MKAVALSKASDAVCEACPEVGIQWVSMDNMHGSWRHHNTSLAVKAVCRINLGFIASPLFLNLRASNRSLFYASAKGGVRVRLHNSWIPFQADASPTRRATKGSPLVLPTR